MDDSQLISTDRNIEYLDIDNDKNFIRTNDNDDVVISYTPIKI